MVEQTVSLDIFVQLFVFGAFMFFLACSAATVVMTIHLSSLPERGNPQPQIGPSASFTD